MKDSKSLRDTLSSYPTGVTIMTTMDGDLPVGVTINSYTPVTLDPPTILFCLSSQARSFTAFEKADYFVVNFLSDSQSGASHAFATHDPDRWKKAQYTLLEKSRCPMFLEAAGHLECKRVSMIPYGDHHIIMGEIINHHRHSDAKPLVYFERHYYPVSGTTLPKEE